MLGGRSQVGRSITRGLPAETINCEFLVNGTGETNFKAVIRRPLLAFLAQFAFDTTSNSISNTVVGRQKDLRRQTLALDEPDR